MKAKNPVVLTIVLVIIAAGAAFFGGMQYQKSQRNSQFAQFAGRAGAGGNTTFQRRIGGQNSQNGQAIIGEVIKSDDTSITVKTQDGSSKIVLLSGSTGINKQATGTKDDLTTGEKVAVFGSSNSDGSVTAQSIQLNPMMGNFRGGPPLTPTPSK